MISPIREVPKLGLGRSEWIILGVIFVYSFIPVVGGLIRVFELTGGPQIAPVNPRALLAPLPIILHIMSSSLFCVLGAFQFLPSPRRQRPAAHRVIGRLIAVAGCISALTGQWMTHFYVFPEALQGPALYWVRIVLGTAMVGLIIWAVIAIRSRNVFQHSASMVRAYAIGQGASTQAVLGIAWIIAVGSEAMGPLRDGLMIFAWVVNLLAAEIFIRAMLRPPKRQQKHSSLPPYGLQHQEMRSDMTHQNGNPRLLLSILWVFIILNFFARDIHELGRPGMLEQMMSGTIDGVVVTEMLMLIGGIMIEIPILMTVLALLLPYGTNRWANIGVGLLTMVMILAMNLKPDLDNVFFMGIQLIALVGIVGVAWRWRGPKPT